HPSPTSLYSLALHDALPILFPSSPALHPPTTSKGKHPANGKFQGCRKLCRIYHCRPPPIGLPAKLPTGKLVSGLPMQTAPHPTEDRKSTRLNSSHVSTSYAV